MRADDQRHRPHRRLGLLLLFWVAGAGCSSDGSAVQDSAVLSDGLHDAGGDAAGDAQVDSAPVSPWRGCHNSGGERSEGGCFFEWHCPHGTDRRVSCQSTVSGFTCTCTDKDGSNPQGQFDDGEACGRTAQEIADAANRACGWELPDEV